MILKLFIKVSNINLNQCYFKKIIKVEKFLISTLFPGISIKHIHCRRINCDQKQPEYD